MKLFAAALAFFFSLNAFAAPYPNEAQLRSAIENVAGILKSEGLQLAIFDTLKEGMTQPLFAAGLSLTSGKCMIFFNTRPEDGLNQFFDAIPEKDIPIWLNAMAVHEATHCIEQREAYVRKRFDIVLPPSLKQDSMTIQGYLSVVKSGLVETWGEALADIASVLYLKQVEPERWQHFAKGIATMRHGLAWKWPEHDTSPWLLKVIAANAESAPNQTLFDAAFQLRRKFRP